MTRDELKDVLLEACMPATMLEVVLISIAVWCMILIGVGLGG